MKLSSETIQILKNFSSINQNLLISPGNKLRTISPTKILMAEAVIPDNFPREVAIYDLNTFLNSLSLVSDPDIDFGDHSMVIRDDKNSVEYRYSNPSVIVTPPTKELNLPTQDVCAQLQKDDFKNALRAASVLQVPDISFVGQNGFLYLRVCDRKNSGSNSWILELGETEDKFQFNLKVEHLKMIHGDYDVIISQKLLSKFEHKDLKLVYYCALEPDSFWSAS